MMTGTDWLDDVPQVQAADDWLDLGLPEPKDDVSAEEALPTTVSMLLDASEHRLQFNKHWASLSEKQRVVLNMVRECRFNVSRALRCLEGTNFRIDRKSERMWRAKEAYEFCRLTMIKMSSAEAMMPDKLILRHDDAVESMLTPGIGFNPSSAAKANETLMKVGGMLKGDDRDVNVNVGPSLVIQVMQPGGKLIEMNSQSVEIPSLPAPESE